MAVASGTEWLGCLVLQGTAYGLFCEDPEKILHTVNWKSAGGWT